MAYEDEEYEKELVSDPDTGMENIVNIGLGENFDTTQGEFEVYSLITDISELYGSLYEEVSTKLSLSEPENRVLLDIWNDFDTTLALSTIFMMETIKAIRELLNNDTDKIQGVLSNIIKNTNKSLDDIDPVEPEAPEEYFETDTEDIIYN